MAFLRFRRQLSEPCHSFPSPAPAPMGRDGRPLYHRQMSEPSIPFQSQGFKQEYSDPLFEHPLMVGAPLPQSYPPTMMIKQEPRDFTYDSGDSHKHSEHILYLICIYLICSSNSLFWSWSHLNPPCAFRYVSAYPVSWSAFFFFFTNELIIHSRQMFRIWLAGTVSLNLLITSPQPRTNLPASMTGKSLRLFR